VPPSGKRTLDALPFTREQGSCAIDLHSN
jgi:hypothetical protein